MIDYKYLYSNWNFSNWNTVQQLENLSSDIPFSTKSSVISVWLTKILPFWQLVGVTSSYMIFKVFCNDFLVYFVKKCYLGNKVCVTEDAMEYILYIVA